MDNIIEELLLIEEQAAAAMAGIKEDRQNLENRIQTMTDEIKSRAEKETTEKINRLYEEAKLDSQDQVRRMHEESRVWFTDMQNDFADRHEQWEDEIFQRIIGR